MHLSTSLLWVSTQTPCDLLAISNAVQGWQSLITSYDSRFQQVELFSMMNSCRRVPAFIHLDSMISTTIVNLKTVWTDVG